jgi:hypothetical protein
MATAFQTTAILDCRTHKRLLKQGEVKEGMSRKYIDLAAQQVAEIIRGTDEAYALGGAIIGPMFG